MTTLHLLIACVTVLAMVVVVVRALGARDERRAQVQRETAMHDRAGWATADELRAAIDALTTAAAAIERQAGERGPSRLGQRVTVHTKQPDDQAIFGVVTGDYTDRLVLEDAEYLLPGGRQALPGRQDIDRDIIAWIDLHGPVTTDIPAAAEAPA